MEKVQNIHFHPEEEIFRFQTEVRGTCISKKKKNEEI